ncbi:unnamed protein product [Notodromas monacha]|uniref:cellulase n=1 Tax=Notodromas monacha TaxID=399045 RepID=A0A7R9GGD5_9CRUS|nr:unnamed protein product [Notodromas monacha]CAG0919841.1 unnamed protein product [Notodromas monacha]
MQFKMKVLILLCSVVSVAFSQNVGTNTQEQHLSLPMQVCSGPGSCSSEQTTVVMDANWRWTLLNFRIMQFKMKVLILLCSVVSVAFSQNVGTNTQEQHLSLPMQVCSGPGSCSSEQTTVVMDANWRWTHKTNEFVNCYTGNTWDASICPDAATCTQNCAVDGIDTNTWSGTYGVTTSGNALTLKFVTSGPFSKNIGSRVYLLATEDKYKRLRSHQSGGQCVPPFSSTDAFTATTLAATLAAAKASVDENGGIALDDLEATLRKNVKMFQLKNREFSLTVDVSNLPCGLNGAVYFVEMDEDGGLSKYPTNHAGAKYGTGYCDAQCPHDLKWINGETNSDGWVPASNDANSGAGKYGTCCFEMDIWEANSMAQSFTPHNCAVEGQYRCEGTECGDNESGDRYDGVCDKDGCDWAAYRLGQHDFYGPGKTVDTNQPFTLITQFITSDGTDNGDLVEIRRIYRQNGREISNTFANFPGVPAHDSVTDDYCTDIKNAFGDVQDFAQKGGMRAMGRALDRGLVLTMSLWDDHYAFMHWLDATYPEGSSEPGALRGPCPDDGGDPAELENTVPNSSFTLSDIRVGPIGSL